MRQLRALRHKPPEEAAFSAVEALNLLRRREGADPMRLRRLDVRFVDLGRPEQVDLPADAVAVPLDVLVGRGRDEVEVTASAGETASRH